MSVLVVCIVAAVFGFVGSMPLAGPVSVLVVSRAVRKQYGPAVRVALGASLAETFYASVAFLGFAALLSRHPIVRPISHGVTAMLLLGLGAYFMKWRDDRGRTSKHEGRAGTFLLGFVISIANPTLLITWSAATSMLYQHDVVDAKSWMALPFGLCAGGGVAAWNVVLVALLRKLGDRFPRGAITWLVRGMGLVLVGAGVWSAIQLAMYLRGHVFK